MMKHSKSSLYDLERSVEDQVYGGAKMAPQKVRQAVASTRGIYLSDGHDPMKAFFHSRCGGTTEVPSAVWKNHSKYENQITSVVCPYCSKHPYAWHAWVKLTDLFSALRWHPLLLKTFGLFTGAQTPSGRISSMVLRADGKAREITTNEIRSALGFSKIKSGYFNWKIKDEGVQFDGIGSGHGVGMCQWGARFMAQEGKPFQDILHHYFPYGKLASLVQGRRS